MELTISMPSTREGENYMNFPGKVKDRILKPFINTRAIKNTHDTDDDRFYNLLDLLDESVYHKLKEKGISIGQDKVPEGVQTTPENFSPLIFQIKTWEKESLCYEIHSIWDFYKILRKNAHLFFQGNSKWQNWKIREIDTKSEKINYVTPTEIQLLEAFVETFSDSQTVQNECNPRTILEWEKVSITQYTESRKQAINDTLASSEFISDRNARNYGEKPFYEYITDNPRLKKKAVLLANMLWENENFIKYANESLSKNPDLIRVFCDILENIKTDSLQNFAAILQIPNFTSYLVWPYEFSEEVCENLAGIISGLPVEHLIDLFESIFLSEAVSLNAYDNLTTILKFWKSLEKMKQNYDAVRYFLLSRGNNKLTVDEIDFLEYVFWTFMVSTFSRILKNFHRHTETTLKVFEAAQNHEEDTAIIISRYFYLVDQNFPDFQKWMDFPTTLSSKIDLMINKTENVKKVLSIWRNPSSMSWSLTSLAREYDTFK